MVGRRLRLVSDTENAFQERRLLVAAITPDSVSDRQGADDGRNSREQIAGFVKNRGCGMLGQIDILIRLIRDRNLNAILSQQLCNSGSFIGVQTFSHDNRRHADQVGGFGICIAENVLKEVACLCLAACSAGYENQIVLIGVGGSRNCFIKQRNGA